MLKHIPLRRFSAPILARFWEKIDKVSDPKGCWLWTASIDGFGYGKFKVGGTTFRAHRYSYFLETGVDPADKMICHKCDVPRCCNPDHHFLGTNSDNIKDAHAKGRVHLADSRGEKNGYAKLTQAQVDQIRAMILGGKTNTAIGRVFGVTHQAVSRIRRGKAWGTEPMQKPYASIRRTG